MIGNPKISAGNNIWIVRNLLQISRPFGWILGFASVRAGMIMGGASATPESLLLLFFGTFPFSFWLFGWNDLSDRECDRINPRKPSWIHGGLVTEELVPFVRLVLYLLLLVPAVGAFLWSWQTTLLVLMVYFLSLLYSLKPVRFKEMPVMDAYCATAIIWALFAAGFSMGSPLRSIPVEAYCFLPTIIAAQIYSTVTDIECDAKVGYTTAATRFGKRFTFFLSAFFAFLSLIALPFVNYARLVEFVIIAQFLVFLLSWLFSEQVPFKICYLTLFIFNHLAGLLFIIFRF